MMILRGGQGVPGEIIFFALNRKNLSDLAAGQPILMTRRTHGTGVPAGWSIGIIIAENEIEIANMLSAAGVLGPGMNIVRNKELDDK